MADPTYDAVKIAHFQNMFKNAMQYAANANLPMIVVEAECRSALAHVESHRLLGALRSHGAKV